MVDGQGDADGVAEVVGQDQDDLRGGDAEAEGPSINDVTLRRGRGLPIA